MSQIFLLACDFAPRYLAYCNGALYSIAQNSALFSLLGTTYGGNGVETYGVPDLRGRVAVEYGQGLGLTDYTLGEFIGAEAAQLISATMPTHTHVAALSAVNAPGDSSMPGGNYLAQTGRSPIYSNASPTVTLNGPTLQNAGSNAPFSIVQPSLALNYCIVAFGIYPSRN